MGIGRARGYPPAIVLVGVEPGSVNSALQPLRTANKLDRYRSSARILLEPWLVEAALARFGDRRLSREEQGKVVARCGRRTKYAGRLGGRSIQNRPRLGEPRSSGHNPMTERARSAGTLKLR